MGSFLADFLGGVSQASNKWPGAYQQIQAEKNRQAQVTEQRAYEEKLYNERTPSAVIGGSRFTPQQVAARFDSGIQEYAATGDIDGYNRYVESMRPAFKSSGILEPHAKAIFSRGLDTVSNAFDTMSKADEQTKFEQTQQLTQQQTAFYNELTGTLLNDLSTGNVALAEARLGLAQPGQLTGEQADRIKNIIGNANLYSPEIASIDLDRGFWVDSKGVAHALGANVAGFIQAAHDRDLGFTEDELRMRAKIREEYDNTIALRTAPIERIEALRADYDKYFEHVTEGTSTPQQALDDLAWAFQLGDDTLQTDEQEMLARAEDRFHNYDMNVKFTPAEKTTLGTIRGQVGVLKELHTLLQKDEIRDSFGRGAQWMDVLKQFATGSGSRSPAQRQAHRLLAGLKDNYTRIQSGAALTEHEMAIYDQIIGTSGNTAENVINGIETLGLLLANRHKGLWERGLHEKYPDGIPEKVYAKIPKVITILEDKEAEKTEPEKQASSVTFPEE